MPLLKVAQSHSCLNQPVRNFYIFSPTHKAGWLKFWEEMDGDQDKILDFAKKAEIDNPKEWYEELHRFLFDFFAGNDKLLKSAAKKKFSDFLAQVAENHINDPKDKYWYFGKGLNPNEFIRVMEYAAEFSKPEEAIIYINARTPDYGAELYSEWLLSKTLNKNEFVSLASNLNKKAYLLENEVLGKDHFLRIKIGSKISHAKFPGEEFTVKEVKRSVHRVRRNKQIVARLVPGTLQIIVEDEKGKVGHILDPWNISI